VRHARFDMGRTAMTKILCVETPQRKKVDAAAASYDELVQLFLDWRMIGFYGTVLILERR
jgi:hypothetical protein